VTYNTHIKVEMAVKSKRKFQDGLVRITDNTKRQYELYSIKQKAGAADSIVITSEAGMSEGHSDYAWAAFLGLHAAELNAAPFGWSKISKPESGPFAAALGRVKQAIGL
jgi:phage FluMu gp28-like protein